MVSVKGLGHGKGYLYPHDFPHGLVKQQYLPDRLKDKTYYSPTENGREIRIKEWVGKNQKLEGLNYGKGKSIGGHQWWC